MFTPHRWLAQRTITLFGAAIFASALSVASSASAGSFYAATPLVSNEPGVAPHTDPLLRNAWGLASAPTTPIWVADNAEGVATIYTGTGQPAPLIVTIPPPDGAPPPSAPTGQIFNPTSDFVVSKGGASGAAVFLFATEDGTIAGWSPQVDRQNAILGVDNSASGAVYKGLALGTSALGNVLYATNFHTGSIDVFDATFAPVSLDGNFVDKHAASGYAPFDIANIQGQLFVTYAKQDADKHDDVPGVGKGFVDVFDLDGHFQFRFAQSGRLNSPWGMALAPANFGRFSNALLIGNFGDGHILAFDIPSRAFLGQLSDPRGAPLAIDGLWGLLFGNGSAGQPTNRLFFSAGPDHEENGLFGSIQACTTGRGCI
jgi:uncharacterized protein (TIGR03118 family)